MRARLTLIAAAQPIALRLVAIRKPKQARDLSIEKLKRRARQGS
ncbi:hypothetical protein [Bradyrhizobium sp. USDA 4504]